MKLPSNSIGRAIVFLGFSIAAGNVSGAAIVSGAINLTSFVGNGTFTLSGTDFSLAGSFDGPAFSAWSVIDSCHPCGMGFSLPVDGQSAGLSFHGGSGTIGALTYPSVLWGDDLAAQGSLFIITGPHITLSGPGVYTGAFSLTGFLCGTTSGGPPPHTCALDAPALTGSGQVTVNVVLDSGSLLRSDSATYTFTSVPEASTLALVAPAALILLISVAKLDSRK